MAQEPLVCCICPYHLPGFIERAHECFMAQTYQNKVFTCWNTSGISNVIGTIRNAMISRSDAPIIAHWDYDDWSAPTRLAEQVEFMQSTGAPVVGYRDMPFYDQTLDAVKFYDSHRPTGYVLGTSLMYRREVWERTPFPDSNDEDGQWQRTLGVDAIKSQSSLPGPRMVATIHPSNTSPKKGARFEKASAGLDAAVRSCLSLRNVAQ